MLRLVAVEVLETEDYSFGTLSLEQGRRGLRIVLDLGQLDVRSVGLIWEWLSAELEEAEENLGVAVRTRCSWV